MIRRRFLRVPVQVWVEQWTDRETYHQQSSNLSLGGIYLDRTVPHPEGTLVNLKFTLPGDEHPIACKGRIVYPRGLEDDFGMGLEFVDLPPADEDRVAAFLREELSRLPADVASALAAVFGSDGLVFESPAEQRGGGASAGEARGKQRGGEPTTGPDTSGAKSSGKFGAGVRTGRKGKGSGRR